MNTPTFMEEVRSKRQAALDETVGLAIGVGFTFALFLGMAHFENFGTAEPITEIEDLRLAAMPIEPPPPPPKLEKMAELPEASLPFAGLEIGPADSPVSIAVVPPDMEQLIPSTTIPPRAKIEVGVLHTEFKPKVNVDFDVRHVFQESEVDQKAHWLVRTTPLIPADVSGRASMMGVGLLLLIDVSGRVESARVMESSGNPRFDEIVVNTVRNEWVFSPGILRGKKVRVLAQQPVRIKFSSSTSPFSVTP